MKLIPLLTAMVLSGCAAISADSAFIWTPTGLNENKKEMDGKVVVVRAYLIDEQENHALWESLDLFEEGKASHCISLIYGGDMRMDIQKYNRKEVIIRGVFKRNFMNKNEVWLGMCNVSGLNVIEVVK